MKKKYTLKDLQEDVTALAVIILLIIGFVWLVKVNDHPDGHYEAIDQPHNGVHYQYIIDD